MRNEDAGVRAARGKKRQEEAENEAGSIEHPEYNSEKRWTSECVRLQWYYKPSKLIIRPIVGWFCRRLRTWERKWMAFARLLWKLLLLRTSNNYPAISVLQSVTFHFRARNFILYKRVYIGSIVVILQFETPFLGSLIFSYRAPNITSSVGVYLLSIHATSFSLATFFPILSRLYYSYKRRILFSYYISGIPNHGYIDYSHSRLKFNLDNLFQK